MSAEQESRSAVTANKFLQTVDRDFGIFSPFVSSADFAYVDENPVADDFLCLVCHEPLYVPVIDSCGRLFCRSCVAQTSACPNCRNALNLSNVVPLMIKNTLNALQVRCPTCASHISRDAVERHFLECEQVCPQQCGAKVKPSL